MYEASHALYKFSYVQTLRACNLLRAKHCRSCTHCSDKDKHSQLLQWAVVVLTMYTFIAKLQQLGGEHGTPACTTSLALSSGPLVRGGGGLYVKFSSVQNKL